VSHPSQKPRRKPRSAPPQSNSPSQSQQSPKASIARDLHPDFHNEAGGLPGTLRIPQHAIFPQIHLTDYSANTLETYRMEEPEAIAPHLDSHSVSWIDIQGLGSEDILRRVGQVFGLHPLVLEDIVNVPQRPKIEEHNDQLLFIARMVCLCDDRGGPTSMDGLNVAGSSFVSEQVSFILRENALLSVQEEGQYDSFDNVRERLRLNKGILRKRGPDYLLYVLLDAIIDGFFPILETYGERIELLEDEVVLAPTAATLTKIHQLKRELLTLRRAIWPQRDAINSLIRDGSVLIGDDVTVYLRDCYDHTVQVLDMVETYRELASSLMDVYLSSVSNRMNEVMKLLTVISSIFIPLTFIAGIYGMNFSSEKSPFNMPELNWYWGYAFCWGLMLTVTLGLVFFFYKKGWFENFSGVR
jgi:magnesium transporter